VTLATFQAVHARVVIYRKRYRGSDTKRRERRANYCDPAMSEYQQRKNKYQQIEEMSKLRSG
jgi:hypothetical protein